MSAFNAEDTIGASLDSILRQDFTDWELVIVDDGSTDSTRTFLEAAARADTRVHLVVHAENKGLPASLNDAIRVARGALIARMDADDRSLPHRLRMQAEFLDAHPEVAILGAAALEIDEDGRELGEIRRPELHDDLVRRIYQENPFIHPSVMARREVFTRLGGYSQQLRRGQDYDLWLRAYKTFRLHNLQSPLIWYQRRRRARWRDAWYSSKVVYLALRRERRLWRGAWLVSRPPAAAAWERVRHIGLRKS